MATKIKTNGTPAPKAAKNPFEGATPAPPPPHPPVPPAPPTVDEAARAAKAYRAFVLGLTGQRIADMADKDPQLTQILGAAFFDFEERKRSFQERQALLAKEALEFGYAPRPGVAKAKPTGAAKSKGGAIDPAIEAKVLADLAANPKSLSKDVMTRTGLAKEEWSKVKDQMIESGKLVKHGTRGPTVSFSVA